MKPLDAALLLFLACRHYGYYHLPESLQAEAFSVAGGLCLLVALYQSTLHWALKAWAMGEELLVVGCTSAWAVWRWESTSGELCSDAIGLQLGAIGLCALAVSLKVANRTSVQVTEGER